MPQEDRFIIKGPPLPPFKYTSFWDHIRDKLLASGDHVAQVFADTGQQQTCSEILKKVEQLAAALQAKGIKYGDVVAICSENCIEYCLPVLATLVIGAICAPLNATYTLRELTHVFSIEKPKLIFCSSTTEKLIHSLVTEVSYVQDVIVMSEESHYPQYPTLTELLKQGEDKILIPHKVKDPKDEVAFVFCSSGTTGLPKGVMLTHQNMLTLSFCLQHPDFTPPGLQEKNLIGFLPFFHIYGMMILLLSFVFEQTNIIMKQFNPELFLKIIQDYKIISCPLVPPIINFLNKYPSIDKYDLSSLKYITVGAAPLSSEGLALTKKTLPHLEDIRQGYGLTEHSAVATIQKHTDKILFESVGKVLPGVEAKIIDPETNKSLGPNKKGELCFRSALVMKGYMNNPKATAETIDSDGWLHTGDVGYYDKDHCFYIVDRLKELIKYKGFQVPPAELEGILMSHPAVMDAAVIGIPDKRAGEVAYGFVVKKSSVTEKELLKFVAGQVSQAKRLHGGIEFVESIPKNPSGKILRRELREYMKNKEHKKSKL